MTKKIGLSLVAATLLTSSAAMAFEDTKVTGGLKLWYQTQSHDETVAKNDEKTFFDREASSGDFVANIGITSKANDHVGLGLKMYSVTTLGLENNTVSGEAIGGATGAYSGSLNGQDPNPYWVGEAYFTYSAANTVVKVGRQELDTPLAFTEKWNAAPNTFEATAIINNDVPDTTIVAAYVAKGNGHANTTTANTATIAGATFNNYWALGIDNNGDGVADDTGGAYALGLLNKTVESVPVNIWLYDVLETASATWIDAAVSAGPAKIQALYANVAPTGATQTFFDGTAAESQATTAMAVKASATFGGINAYAAMSQVSEGNLPVANTATGFKKTKLYTASIFSDGLYAAQPDTTAMKLGASMKMGEASKLAVSYGTYTLGKNEESAGVSYTVVGAGGQTGADEDVTEIDVVYSTKVSDINLKACYMNQTNYDLDTDGKTSKDRQFIRIIAGIDF